MLTNRQQMILKAIVEEFVRTAEPVGSKTLLERYGYNYSSATIRNEMNYLETEGLLEKTHTSSGRVPSTQGYRYYVENLMEKDADEEELGQLQTFFSKDMAMEDIIQASCDVLSNMTNLTSLVLGPDANRHCLRHIKMFPLDERSAVAVFITDQGHTENKTFHFSDDISASDIENCTAILNDRLAGTPITEVVAKMNELKPVLAQSVKRHEALFNAFMQAFIRFASDNVYYSGTSNMLYQPEFSDLEKVRELMRMLENSEIWRSIEDQSNALKLENPSGGGELVWMNDIAVVSKNFNLNGEEGKLMVVGPSRMNYNRIVSILDMTAAWLEKHNIRKK